MRREIVLVTVSLSALAHAQPAPEEAPADVAFRQGRAALEAGNANEACEKFQESFRHAPDSPATMLNLGLCNEALGRTASALRWFRKAQVRGSETGNTDFEDAAKRKTLALAHRVPTFRVVIVDAPPGAVLTLDGAPMSELDFARVEVDPGKHVFEVLVGGRIAVHEETTVEDGEKPTLRLVVPKLEKRVERRLVVVDPGAKQRRNAYLLGGASIVLFAGAAVVIGSTYNDFHATESPVQQEKARDRMNFGGGGLALAGTVAAGAAIYFYLEAPGKRRIEQNVLAPVVAPHHVGVSLRGSF